MPAAMVQLASCGNIFVLISSSEGRQVISAMRIPPQQRPARHHLRREQPDAAPELKPEDMSDIAEMSAFGASPALPFSLVLASFS